MTFLLCPRNMYSKRIFVVLQVNSHETLQVADLRLSKDIDKATDTFINATLELESAIRKYNSAQTALGNAVDTISGKVDTINKHIDNVLKEAPTKLQVSVKVSDADWKRIQDMFDKQHQWMTSLMQKHIREVNEMFADERRRVQQRYKEYDGSYLGHYVQWFFWFFFVLGFFLFTSVIVMTVGKGMNWLQSSNVTKMVCESHFGNN